MSVQNLLYQNGSGLDLDVASISLSDGVYLGNVPNQTQFLVPPSLPTVGNLLKVSNVNAGVATLSLGQAANIVYNYGGVLSVGANVPVPNGNYTSTASANDTAIVATRHVMITAGNINFIAWAGNQAMALAQMKIRKNGADAYTATLSGLTGVAAISPPVSVAVGDTISLFYTQIGVPPLNSNWALYVN